MSHNFLPTSYLSADPQVVLSNLQEFPQAYHLFTSLPPDKRSEFLDFCCGKSGLYLCYDVFFKKIFDPFIHQKRLEDLISAILGQKIEIIEIIPNEGFHLSDRGSFVIVDIVVRLADHTILNVEIQKNGYNFPGKRFDCYCADLIMREYNRLREQEKERFSYSKMPPVISIALLESSTEEFYKFPEHYVHLVRMESNTGIHIENLPRHIYISLDIFHNFMQNKPIQTTLEAWLMLLTTRNLERIQELIEKFPEFSDIYREIFELRTKPEELIHMFSKVLLEGDLNMERFMIDEWKQEAKAAREEAETARQEADVAKQEADAAKQEADVAKQEADVAKQEADVAKQEADVLKESLARTKNDLAKKDNIIAELQARLAEAGR